MAETSPLTGAARSGGRIQLLAAAAAFVTLALVGVAYNQTGFEGQQKVQLAETEKGFIFDLFSSAKVEPAPTCAELPSCGAGPADLKPDEYGACPGDGSYDKLAADVGQEAFDHVLYIANEAKGKGYQQARALMERPDCKSVLTGLKASTPTFSFKSVGDALKILANKRVLYVGDSLTRGAFRDLCYWLGGSSPPGKVQDNLHCTPSAAMTAAGFKLDSRWIPYADTEFTKTNFTDLMDNADISIVMAGNWYSRYSSPHVNNSMMKMIADARNATMITGNGVEVHNKRAAAQLKLQALKTEARADDVRNKKRQRSLVINEKLEADGLQGYTDLVGMIAEQPAEAVANKVFIIRSPPVFGNPYVVEEAGSLHNDFHDFNRILVEMQKITENTVVNSPKLKAKDYLNKGIVRYLDATSYSFNATSGLRTSCPLFTAAQENCACHMADELGWRSMNQQLLNGLC